MKKINIIRRSPHPKSTDESREIKPRVTMRIGARVTTITFPKRKDGRVKGEVAYRNDFSVPQLKDTNTIIQEEA